MSGANGARRANNTKLLAIAGMIAVWVSGCATAQPTDRHGLLEENESIASSAAAPKRLLTGIPKREPGAVIAGGRMTWPLADIQVTSTFGKRGKDFHEGIDLRAHSGTTVFSAQDGVVLYAGSRIRGYGRMIVVRHQRKISTIYAHNSKLLVRVGQKVRRGQKIAISGRSGHVTGPHLHFEIRDGQAALDPMEFLPGLETPTVLTTSAAAPVAAPQVAQTVVAAPAPASTAPVQASGFKPKRRKSMRVAKEVRSEARVAKPASRVSAKVASRGRLRHARAAATLVESTE